MQVQNLKMLQSNYYSERFDLEDKVTREYPQDIARYNSQIKALNVDIETASKTLKASADYFNGMDINGEHYTEKKAAGEAIIRIMKFLRTHRKHCLWAVTEALRWKCIFQEVFV